ncbi:DUF3536 domain-containing protein [Candidatus Magnetomonas plexicatena]|uniref:DUF3536 domain-containing protein n=1 Tax=Candidatus Magnetomonas plexicatena TaxID=2552947 RepID=UPI001C77EC02|nr:DUF3536 domain-containing protein [Nitrospirales bacterium LBB_01]
MEKYVCIHGHFYQPPRENPWLGEVEFQDSAYPYHDWNERITAECYAPNTASRMLDSFGKITDIVNNYSRISFNFGPTLLSWLQRHRPDVYEAILEADKLSMKRFSGHGSALAQCYNHMIMPLSNERDKITQVVWAIEDFKYRFNRMPEGMWLPETAVDLETLEILVEHGIKFTILAPRQASMVKKIVPDEIPNREDFSQDDDNEPALDPWTDVSNGRIDPSTVYLCNLPSGKTINLFFYDGPISSDIAFSGLLNSGENFVERLMGAISDEREHQQLIHIATDGETYGHHHRNGEMALTYCLHLFEQGQYHGQDIVKLTNYGQFMEMHQPIYEVKIYDNSSWSCIHGVGRWKEHCGCNSGMQQEWTQHWRAPLRQAMDVVRDRLADVFEDGGKKYLKEPWKARDDYVECLLVSDKDSLSNFINRHALRELTIEECRLVLKLMEMQKNAMYMFTSCGWFFDEISGIETVQSMAYAALAMQYAGGFIDGSTLEGEFINKLREAESNVYGAGEYAYEMFVKPQKVDLQRAGAHFAISSIFEHYPPKVKVYNYQVETLYYDEKRSGRLRIAAGTLKIFSENTWDEQMFQFFVFRGEHGVNCALADYTTQEEFSFVRKEVFDSFEKGRIPYSVRIMHERFGDSHYSLWHLFKDEQRKVLDEILLRSYEKIDSLYRQICESNISLMNFHRGLDIPLPESLSIALVYVLKRDLESVLEERFLDAEKLKDAVSEVKRWDVHIDKERLNLYATKHVNYLMDALKNQWEYAELYEKIAGVLESLTSIGIEPDLWSAQNSYFIIGKEHMDSLKERAAFGDKTAELWLSNYKNLGVHLSVVI